MIEAIHKAWEAVRRRRAWRRSLIAAGLMAAVLVVAFLQNRSRTLRLEALGFQALDENATFQVANYPDYSAYAYPISADGRWLAMRLDIDSTSSYAREERLLFDLRQKQFVAKLESIGGTRHVDLLLSSKWMPDRCPVTLRDYKQEPPGTFQKQEPPGKFQQWVRRLLRLPASEDQKFALYRADIPAMKARVMFSQHFQDGVSAVPNRSLTALFFMRWRYESGNPITEHRLYDLRRLRGGYRLLEPDGRIFPIGWLDDDRTLVVLIVDMLGGLSKKRIELIDAFREGAVRTIPYGPLLEQAQKQGLLGPGTIKEYYGSRVFEGERLRFTVIVSPPGRSGTPEEHWSLWDVDLRTGELTCAMKLDWCERYLSSSQDIVHSPSGNTVVAPVSASTFLMSTIGTSISVAACSSGQAPRLLPLGLRRFYHIGTWESSSQPPASHSALQANMAFLDENTLIYRGADNGLWRYDLRTTQPESLWSPRTPPAGVARGVGRE